MPTIPAMWTPRSPSAEAIRASAPGRSSSLTVNQTVTRAPPVGSMVPGAAEARPLTVTDGLRPLRCTHGSSARAERPAGPDLRARERPGDAGRGPVFQGTTGRD